MADTYATKLAMARIKARLARIPAKTKAAAHAALLSEANRIADEMRKGVPVESGALRDSIQVVDMSGPDYAARFKIKAGGPTTSKAIRNSKKGTAPLFDYAIGVEFGHNTEAGKHVSAQPFFFPAWRRNKRKARAKVTRELKKVVST